MGKSLIERIKRTEKRIDIKAILLSWVLNLVTAFVVFNVSWWLSGDIFVTILYTLSGWAITFSVTVAYWLSWIFNRLKTKDSIKASVAAVLMLMYIIGLYMIWSTFTYVFSLL